MATTTITFNSSLEQINQSLQVGDILYYALIQTSASGFYGSTQFIGNSSNQVYKIGVVKSIAHSESDDKVYIVTQNDGYINPPPTNSFIFFSKDNVVNVSALKGYYGQMKFVNTSNEPAELYAVSCEVTESSK